jgi:hypothetical protein
VYAPRRPRSLTSRTASQGSGLIAKRIRWVACAFACATGLLVLVGCAKMDAALGQQWMAVDFSQGTSVATALHVRTECSNIPHAPPMALPTKRTALSMLYGVRFDTTNASPANVAELQTCLQRFPSVQGVEPGDAGDEGS